MKPSKAGRAIRPIVIAAVMMLCGGVSTVTAYELWDPYHDGITVSWPDEKIPVDYYLDSAGSDDISGSDALTAIDKSFEEWSKPATTYISSNRQGAFPGIGTFADDGFNTLFWVESHDDNYGPLTTNTLGVTVLTGKAGLTHGVLTDVDIAFNGVDFVWSAEATSVSGKIDVQAVATHEIGHFFGLDHSDVLEATMYPVYQGVGMRSLATDDIEGISFLYPYQGVSNFAASPVSIADASWIVLSWNNSRRSSYDRTEIRYRTDGVCPESVSDGILLGVVRGTPGEGMFLSHTNVQPETTYSYSAFVYDNTVGLTVPSEHSKMSATAQGTGGDIDEGSGGCFIATLCYGDLSSDQVSVLRHFRDRVLARSAPGRLFINYYYWLSPSACRILSRIPGAVSLVRRCLDPVVVLTRTLTGGGPAHE